MDTCTKTLKLILWHKRLVPTSSCMFGHKRTETTFQSISDGFQFPAICILCRLFVVGCHIYKLLELRMWTSDLKPCAMRLKLDSYTNFFAKCNNRIRTSNKVNDTYLLAYQVPNLNNITLHFIVQYFYCLTHNPWSKYSIQDTN